MWARPGCRGLPPSATTQGLRPAPMPPRKTTAGRRTLLFPIDPNEQWIAQLKRVTVTAESGSGTVEDDRRKEVSSTRVRCAPVKLAVRYGPTDSQTRLSKPPLWPVE